MTRIRVAIADDQPMIRNGFRLQVLYAPDLDFAGEAADGLQAVELARTAAPDVLLMDVRMPGIDGIEATRRIVNDPTTRQVRVLVLTTFDLDDYVYGALRAGASGFLLKDTSPEDLHRAIHTLAAGNALLAPTITRRLVAEFATRPIRQPRTDIDITEKLTPREVEVLRLVARGRSNAELAADLVLSPLTAKTHVSRMLTKLGLRDRTQLVIAAYEAGLVRRGEPDL